MMKKLTNLFIFSLMLIAESAHAQANEYSDVQLICTPDSSIGFTYDKREKKWVSASFSIKHKLSILKSDADGIAYVVKNIQNNNVRHTCKKPIDEYGYLYCGGFFRESRDFQLNVLSGRYIDSSSNSYIDVFPEAIRKRMLKDRIKADQKFEKETGTSLGIVEPPTDESADTPFMEIGKCEKI